MPVFALRATELEHFLELQPTVHHAEVYIDAMENLHVDMYQRDPLLRIVEAQGAQYYIDVEGRKIPNSNRYSARVPVVTGIQKTILEVLSPTHTKVLKTISGSTPTLFSTVSPDKSFSSTS